MTLPWLTGRLFEVSGPEAMLYVVGFTILAGFIVFASLRLHVSHQGLKSNEFAAN